MILSAFLAGNHERNSVDFNGSQKIFTASLKDKIKIMGNQKQIKRLRATFAGRSVAGSNSTRSWWQTDSSGKVETPVKLISYYK